MDEQQFSSAQTETGLESEEQAESELVVVHGFNSATPRKPTGTTMKKRITPSRIFCGLTVFLLLAALTILTYLWSSNSQMHPNVPDSGFAAQVSVYLFNDTTRTLGTSYNLSVITLDGQTVIFEQGPKGEKEPIALLTLDANKQCKLTLQEKIEDANLGLLCLFFTTCDKNDRGIAVVIPISYLTVPSQNQDLEEVEIFQCLKDEPKTTLTEALIIHALFVTEESQILETEKTLAQNFFHSTKPTHDSGIREHLKTPKKPIKLSESKKEPLQHVEGHSARAQNGEPDEHQISFPLQENFNLGAALDQSAYVLQNVINSGLCSMPDSKCRFTTDYLVPENSYSNPLLGKVNWWVGPVCVKNGDLEVFATGVVNKSILSTRGVAQGMVGLRGVTSLSTSAHASYKKCIGLIWTEYCYFNRAIDITAVVNLASAGIRWKATLTLNGQTVLFQTSFEPLVTCLDAKLATEVTRSGFDFSTLLPYVGPIYQFIDDFIDFGLEAADIILPLINLCVPLKGMLSDMANAQITSFKLDERFAPLISTGVLFSSLATDYFTSITCQRRGMSICLQSTKTSCACGKIREGQPPVTVNADPGTIFVDVSASYGLPDGTCESGFRPGSCHAPSSSQALISACVGQSSCTFKASNSLAGDPCKGKDKFLAYEFYCLPACPCAKILEDSSLTLRAPAGQQFGLPWFADYGLPSGSCSEGFVKSSCSAASSLDVVKAACTGKTECTLRASNSQFGDPCKGADKWLAVAMTCEPACGCFTIAEGQTITIEATPGTVFTGVEFASYGKPTGSCGMGFTQGSCHAIASASIVNSTCYGRPICTLSASNSNFGDPCKGVDKFLFVKMKCGPAPTCACLTLSEGQSKKIDVSPLKIDKINFVSYGTPTGTCATGFQRSTCHASLSQSLITSSCEGKSSCTVSASNNLYGDPCEGEDKTLVVQATCVQARACRCVVIPEGSSQTITALPGMVFTNVIYANYGLYSGSCNTGFTSNGCRSDTIGPIISACIGQSTCTLYANNELFGDPCKGKDKFIVAQFECGPDICSGPSSTPSWTPFYPDSYGGKFIQYEIRQEGIPSSNVEYRLCFQETTGSAGCQGARFSCTTFGNYSSWTAPFLDRSNGNNLCKYQWKIEERFSANTPLQKCRVYFQETEGSSQCKAARNSVSGWSNNPFYGDPFGDFTNALGGCTYSWRLDCKAA